MKRALTLLCLLAAAACRQGPPAGFERHEAADGSYSVLTPKGWTYESSNFGVGFILTRETGEADPATRLRTFPPSLISARRYELGSPEFKDLDSYRLRQPGSESGAPRESKRGDVIVTAFERTESLIIPPNSPKGTAFPLRNLYVIQRKGNEAWVVELSAPAEDFPALVPVAQTVADSLFP